MRKLFTIALIAAFSASFVFTSCQQEGSEFEEIAVPAEVMSKLEKAGFDAGTAEMIDENQVRVEGDILLDIHDLDRLVNTPIDEISTEQYSTNNLVTATPRVITCYMPTGRKGFSAGMQAGLDEAISRFNAEGIAVSFGRASSQSSADIVFKRLKKRDERQGVLGSAGFPTSSGDPFGEISMSGILESSFGLSTDGIATIIAHEMGHCIGFRHTDYFDRSISCGGALSNEGTAGVGANHIPGTPTGADLAGNGSWMLSCTDGSNRDFTANDQTALGYLY